MDGQKKFYITTPIYYVTAKPHLGSLYSTVIADVFARWHKVLGKDVFFLTGTDEHGQKIAQAADKAGKKPQEFVDSFIPAYKEVWKQYEIDYTKFIRTTDPDHIQSVQKWIDQLQQKGDIYKSLYKGWYCVPCETFVTDKEHDGTQNTAAPTCPSCGRETTVVEEETYFFKLSAYQQQLLDFYQQHPNFIQPKERMAEVLNFVKSGLKDLSISRTTISWGIPFNNDPTHLVYVWFDALANYITAIGFNKAGQEKEFNYWWPADVQVLGKDIVRFHAVYWVAFLMASKMPLPKHLLVHGWIKVGQEKMSKSLGNVVDPLVLAQTFDVEAIRYYLLRHLAINHDGEFSVADMEKTINADLANDLGNLLNRLVALAEKNALTSVIAPASWGPQATQLREQSLQMISEVKEYMESFAIHMALARVWQFVNKVNAYFHAAQPWKVVKDDKHAFIEIISATTHALTAIAVMAWPVMPTKMSLLLQSLGVSLPITQVFNDCAAGAWNYNYTLSKIPLLFERTQTQEDAMEESKAIEAVKEQAPFITIDDFMKVQLMVGTIEQASTVEKSDKLLKLMVNFGDSVGVRQIFSGIRAHHTPESLIGKQGIFVVNLQPRKIMGQESQGMMLFAQDQDNKLQLVAPEHSVANGTLLR